MDVWCGDKEELALSFDPDLTDKQASKKGKEIRKEAFVAAIPGMKELLTAVDKAAWLQNYIKSIDGRHIALDSKHKALNYLLQSGAGGYRKRWMCQVHDTIKQIGIEAHQLAFIHDELQFETHPHNAEDLVILGTRSNYGWREYYNLESNRRRSKSR